MTQHHMLVPPKHTFTLMSHKWHVHVWHAFTGICGLSAAHMVFPCGSWRASEHFEVLPTLQNDCTCCLLRALQVYITSADACA